MCVPSLLIARTGTASAYVSDPSPSPVDVDWVLGSNASRKEEMVVTGFLPGEQPPEDGKDSYFYCSECGDGPTGTWQGFCAMCGSRAPPKKRSKK